MAACCSAPPSHSAGNQWSFARVTQTHTHTHSEINAHIKFETYLEFLISSRERVKEGEGRELGGTLFWRHMAQLTAQGLNVRSVRKHVIRQSCHHCRRKFLMFLSFFAAHVANSQSVSSRSASFRFALVTLRLDCPVRCTVPGIPCLLYSCPRFV